MVGQFAVRRTESQQDDPVFSAGDVVIGFLHPCFIYIYTFLKSGIDKSTEWSTIPACPSLMCFFNRGDTEGTNSSKIL